MPYLQGGDAASEHQSLRHVQVMPREWQVTHITNPRCDTMGVERERSPNMSTIAQTIIEQVSRRPWAEDKIVEGAPATHYVGTDAYASVVVKVERYKTGPKAGLVKAVWSCPAEVGEDGNLVPRPRSRWEVADSGEPFRTRREYDRFLRTERRGVARFCARSEGRIAFWNQLVVGYAEDYRDPHF